MDPPGADARRSTASVGVTAVADHGENTVRRAGLALALLLIPLSLFLHVTYQEASVIDGPLRADAYRYYVTALNLHAFGVYSDEPSRDRRTPPASRTELPPGYPLFLAPFFSITSSDADFLERVTTVQALLGALLPFLTYLLARTQIGVAGALAAALLTALSPHLIAIGGFLLTDTLYAFLLLLAMLVFVHARQQPAAWWSLLAGVLFGLAQLVREIGVGIPLVLAPLYFVPFGGQPQGARRRAAGHALLLLVGALLVAAPQAYLHARAVEGHPLREARDPWPLVVAGADIDLADESRPNVRDPELERMKADPAYGAPALLERLRADPLPHLRWYVGGKAAFLWRWDNLYIGDVYQYPMKHRGFDEHGYGAWAVEIRGGARSSVSPVWRIRPSRPTSRLRSRSAGGWRRNTGGTATQPRRRSRRSTSASTSSASRRSCRSASRQTCARGGSWSASG